MAETQAAHRQDLERRVVKSDIFNSRLGLIFGFVIALCFICGSAYLLYNDKTTEGFLMGGVTLFSLVGVFVYGSQQRRKERETKASMEP